MRKENGGKKDDGLGRREDRKKCKIREEVGGRREKGRREKGGERREEGGGRRDEGGGRGRREEGGGRCKWRREDRIGSM